MAGFQIDGLISSINTSEIIEALLSNERAPARRIERSRNSATNKLSAIRSLNAGVLGVSVAATNLASPNTFQGRIANSSQESVARITANSGADLGSYTVSVQQLATNHQISSDPASVFNDVGEAMNLEGAIRVNDRTISIRATDSLRDIAARISNSNAGVSASVVEVEPDQFRLSLRSRTMGSEAFSISNAGTSDILEALHLTQGNAAETIANPITNGAGSRQFNVKVMSVGGLMGLENAVPAGTVSIANGQGSVDVELDLASMSLEDIAAAVNTAAGDAGVDITATVAEVENNIFRLEIASGDGTDPVFTDDGNVLETLGILQPAYTQVDQEGRDAQLTINGISVVRSSNTINDLIDEATISLVSDEDPEQSAILTISEDYGSAADAVAGFVDSINDVKTFLAQTATYDPESEEAGILLGDSAAITTQSSLSSLLFQPVSTLPSQLLETLNGGMGVAAGKIRITDQAGNSAEIDLSSARTVEDVMTAINVNPQIDVTASANRSGTGFLLQDNTGERGLLRVEEVDGGTTAADLGLAGATASGRINGSAVAQAEFLTLNELGVSSNVDGSISFDRSTFMSMVNSRPEAVKAFFSQAESGFAAQASQSMDVLTNARTGLLTIRAESLQTTIDSYTESIEKIDERLVTMELRLRRQFTAMEQTMAQLQQQGDFMTQQMSQLTSMGSKK